MEVGTSHGRMFRNAALLFGSEMFRTTLQVCPGSQKDAPCNTPLGSNCVEQSLDQMRNPSAKINERSLQGLGNIWQIFAAGGARLTESRNKNWRANHGPRGSSRQSSSDAGPTSVYHCQSVNQVNCVETCFLRSLFTWCWVHLLGR